MPNQFIQFLDESPTAWHATENIAQKLIESGFIELKEDEAWKIKASGKYFVVKDGSSIAAFIVPAKKPHAAQIIATHTDSPALKLKPNSEYRVGHMVMFGAEVYGGPLYTSWLNRDLGIAGQITTLDKKGQVATSLVDIRHHPCIIPQLAIHLDRDVNEKGLTLNAQEHLSAIACLSDDEKYVHLPWLLKDQLKGKTLLGYDLLFFPLEKPRLAGKEGELISAYRLDNLASAHAAMMAMQKATPLKNTLQMAIFWDNEEIGSKTARGADSPFLLNSLQRICHLLNLSFEEQQIFLAKSLCTSIDLAHAQHPNYPNKHEPRHPLKLTQGIVLKNNAQNRYASDAQSSSLILKLCNTLKIPVQNYVNRSDIPCGSTVGPVNAGRTGIRTVDIGLAELSMHSTRELMATKDHQTLCTLLQALITCEL